MIYQITYHRHDTNITQTKPVKAETMAKAVQRLLDTAKHHNTHISSLVITIDGTGTHISVCDKCQGIQKVMKHICKECKQ
jgi:3-oxoacyl-(acyl-carrier-protein) synthase